MNKQIDLNTTTPLCTLMNKYGSDKGSGHHNYTKVYDFIFSKYKQKNIRLFELGLGTNNPNLASTMGVFGKPGASLYGWREYFPDSLIFGADIDKDILFTDTNIETFYCDQTNKNSIQNLWNQNSLKENFDIIIEDGLHTLPAQINFLENSIHKLNSGGMYICEDVVKQNIPQFMKYMEESKFELMSYEFLDIPNPRNGYDNILLVIERQAV